GVDYYQTTDYQIFKNGQPFGSTISLKSEQLKVTETGDYTVKVKNGNCEATTEIYKFQKPFIPEVNFSNPTDICNGKSVTLSTKIDANTKIYWERNLLMLPTKTDKLLVDSIGSYKVYVKTPNCDVASDLVKVEKIDLPNTIKLVGDSVYCPNKSVLLSGDFIPNATYEYLQNGKSIFKSTKNEFSTTDKGEFNIKYNLRSCSNTSKVIRLSHLVNVDVIPSDTSYCKGNSVTLTGVANPQYKYKWFKNATEITDASTNILRVNTPGIYNVNVSNGTCEGISKRFSIIEKPALTAIISGDKILDYGDSTVLKFKFESTPPYTIKLNDNQTFTLNTNPAEVKIKPLKSFEYNIASVSNSCGTGLSSGTAKIQVIVLGIEDPSEIKFIIYPNPASEGVYLSNNNLVLGENLNLQIINSKGDIIINKRCIASNVDEYIDLKKLPSGLYLFRVNGLRYSQSFKILKD
ncbi:MAG: T9SS type A sorting domain-containing protein, partial [Leadbetterella sp.]